MIEALIPYGYGQVFQIGSPSHELPDDNRVEGEQQNDDDDDLTPDEKAEAKAQKQYDEMVQMSDRALNRWSEAQPVEVQQAVVDAFVETGILDHEAAGMEEIEAQVIEAAYIQHTERNVLKPLGLTLDQWNSYLSDGDAATLRRAVVNGEWSKLQDHAQKVASYIHQHGDVNKGNY